MIRTKSKSTTLIGPLATVSPLATTTTTTTRAMNHLLNSNRPTPKPWPLKKPSYRSPLLSLSLLTLLFSLLFFLSYYSLTPNSHISPSTKTLNSQFPQCPISQLAQKFLWYAPHSGFSNQVSEFKNAILMAAILNRTLIVPPVLDHHAVALGSCPKFRVSDPNKIRVDVWNHVVELLRTGRYVSMADIVDISSLVSLSVIQTIDFRVFASLWCGVKDFDCLYESNEQSSLFDSLKQCGSLLSGLSGNVDKCVHAVGEDCRTTVWTYQNGEKDGVLDSFQPDEQLKRKKKISYARRRRDVYQTLGPSSAAESATLLAFGSLFTSPYRGSELYIDIHEAPRDQRIQSLIKKIEFLPFVPEILSAGKEFADKNINAHFLCAQLRLLDGQFKNHWKATFLSLKQKVESLGQSPLPIHIFVMTDLPEANWTGSYLGDLARDSHHFKLHFLREEDELVIKTAKKVVAAKHSLRFAFVPESMGGLKHCPSERFPDVLLFIEEAVCSCASLGFVGTAGSTIAESVELMRTFGTCASQSLTAL